MNEMNLSKKISFLFATIFCCLSSILSTIAFDGEKEENAGLAQQPWTVQKATPEDLECFSCIERIGSYKENMGLDPKSPFGVYVLKVLGQPVGIQSLSPQVMLDLLVGEEMTDILPDNQGKRYGTLLRTETRKILEGFRGTCPFRDQPELPLSYLYSDNEWDWGSNHPSLASSFSAGYGVVCIMPGGMGLVHMFSPSDGSMWSLQRTAHLLSASKILMAAFREINKEDLPVAESARSQLYRHLPPHEREATLHHFMEILRDFDLTRDADICSLLSISAFLLEDLKETFHSESMFMGYFKSLKREAALRIIGLISNPETIQPSFLQRLNGFNNLRYYPASHPSILNALQEKAAEK
jgi:hypothetical protein